jgi:hypothetical protein
MPVIISAAVEGVTDEAVVRRLIDHVGAEPGPVYGRKGKSHLRQCIDGYNNAARHAPWLVLVDLDQDADCAPRLRAAWVPSPAPRLCFRVAVHAVEAWLMADVEAISAFLGVARSKVPTCPDSETVPKQTLVNLARTSRRRTIREDMVPRPDSGRAVGPAYVSRLVEFASIHWSPGKAGARSESLRRAVARLEELAATDAT